MESKSTSFAIPSDHFSILETATTRNGVVFDPREPRWVYRDGHSNVCLDFNSIKNISKNLMLWMKMAMLWYIENKSPDHVTNIFWRMKHFLEKIYVDCIIVEVDHTDVMNYRVQLDDSTQWYLSVLAGFLKKWHALGIPGVTKQTVDYLSSIRLKGNRKGEAVLTMDPIMGPFTDVERNALHSAVDSCYAKGCLNIADYMLCLLVMLLGQRPAQYSYLKVCDVRAEQRLDCSFVYILNVPRVKQRGTLPRSEFKERVLIPQIGELLIGYGIAVENSFVGRLKDIKQAPLFPVATDTNDYPEGLEWHRTSFSLRQHIVAVFDRLNVISERTGEPMHISPIRFRRTIGTQAAAEGHGELVIAELLDQSDTQNVGVYVAATPEMIGRVDRAVAAKLAPLAQAFAGVLVDGKNDQGVPPGQRVVAPQYSQDFTPVGSCGQHGFCAFSAPIACYTCANFRAWLDGPHEAVLDYLVAERDRLMQADKRIAAINDRTILAVAQVVEMCVKQRNQQDADG